MEKRGSLYGKKGQTLWKKWAAVMEKKGSKIKTWKKRADVMEKMGSKSSTVWKKRAVRITTV
jgi:hypothetical protein